jgi:arginyl-tRNA synthetase
MFRFEHGKLSTRRGDVIKMEELVDEAVAKTKVIIEEKNPNLENKDTIAEQVGVGALIFNKLYTNRIKDTIFSWDLMLNFDGETGPYVQYTHARACSVLRKGNYSTDFKFDSALLMEDEAFEVARIIYEFPSKIEEAAEKYEPFMIARQLVALAQAFNAFYHHHTILVEDEALRQTRLCLVAAVQLQLKIGLGLLGMAAPTAM